MAKAWSIKVCCWVLVRWVRRLESEMAGRRCKVEGFEGDEEEHVMDVLLGSK